MTPGSLEQSLRLPIRLLPRRRGQIGAILVFAFFLGFSIFWMGGASGILDLDNGAIHIPPPGGWAEAAFGLFGLPFAAIGLCGIAASVLKMLPGSPYYHLEIGADGLLIRSLFKQRRHAWSDLPVFETLERRRRTKNGTRVSWYTIAMESAPLEAGMDAGATRQREVVRIDANEYGAGSGQQDAADLAAWLNDLRARARDGNLGTTEQVQVPAGFIATAVDARSPLRGASDRTPTVVRR